MTVARPARPAVAWPVGLTVMTLASVVLQVTVVTGAPELVTVSGSTSPAPSTARVEVTTRPPGVGDVGVSESLQPASAVAMAEIKRTSDKGPVTRGTARL